jgi:transcriptional regulator with XRE-family HTH domain
MGAMRLAKYRALRGMTQQAVADALNLSKSRISEIENGSGCSLKTALAIEAWSKGSVRAVDLAPIPERA